MNVGQIRDKVKKIFGDEAGVQITTTDIDNWINEAQRQIVMQNEGLLEAVQTTSTVAGQFEYDLPSTLVVLKRISYKHTGETNYNPLKGYSFSEFNTVVDSWDTSSGSSEPYVDNNSGTRGIPEIFTINRNNIVLWPIPDASVADAIKVFFNKTPTLITTSSDIPELPELYHEAIVKYCLQQCYELDEDFDAAGAKSQDMLDDIKLLRGRDDWKQQDRYPTVQVLEEDMW